MVLFNALTSVGIWRGAEISFFPQPLLKLLKVGLQSLQMGSVAPMKLLMILKNPFEVLIIPIFEMTLSILRETTFLVSSEPPRRSPYLKAVDYVIHRKLRDSRKTTCFTENYVIHRAPVETT